MLIKESELDLQNYLFHSDISRLSEAEKLLITRSLRREMMEIYTGMNIYG